MKSELNNYLEFKKNVNEIKYLKNKYNTTIIKSVKKICNINYKNNLIILSCNTELKNLNKLTLFLKSNIKIKSFSIVKSDNHILFKAEIFK
ncbi:putative valyl-tRNA synthetase [Nautilia profundicola AmH]|uniref:Valyl-tRNA synthetase n=1 Tax=Nautilia profundicola (strain ATCC BAA-1463 / DSM 18972 / AmH) TaxID=598659 RepID=B9L744_NAUPA|nr:putative valyl-tRNA synthetase [Nautilia profundicola AmH]